MIPSRTMPLRSSRLVSRRPVLAACALSLVMGLPSCPAVYPELKTPIHSAHGDLEPPPDGLRWIAFKRATIPGQTRDGRKWDSVGGEAPDPYAVLFVNGKVLIKTPTQSNTLAPTWPDGPAGNFWLRDSDRMRLELWDTNPINDHPIGQRDIGVLDDDTRSTGILRVETDSGATVEVAIEAARPRMGLGFSYEVRMDELFVTKVYPYSPAGRAGLRPGHQILALGGKLVNQMVQGEAQGLLNVPRPEGLELRLRTREGQESTVTLKEGAIYLLYSEDGPLR